jgi:hypothetical protein
MLWLVGLTVMAATSPITLTVAVPSRPWADPVIVAAETVTI